MYQLFCFLKKKAIRLLKEGKNLTETEELLLDYLRVFGLIRGTKAASVIGEKTQTTVMLILQMTLNLL